jgi:hypothetical protein
MGRGGLSISYHLHSSVRGGVCTVKRASDKTKGRAKPAIGRRLHEEGAGLCKDWPQQAVRGLAGRVSVGQNVLQTDGHPSHSERGGHSMPGIRCPCVSTGARAECTTGHSSRSRQRDCPTLSGLHRYGR